MSSYKAPERNTPAFISTYHPKKVVATDHTHSDLGGGDVKKSADNTFSGRNVFNNANGLTMVTEGTTSQIVFEEDGSPSTNAAIGWSTSSIDGDINGEMRIRSHVLTIENSNNVDALQFDGSVGTFSAPPVCSVAATTDNQLVNKSYVDNNLFLSGMIMIWSGSISNIPSGWLLCDGNNSTPNLSGKFILGYGSGHAKAGTMNNNAEDKIVENTHLPPIVHQDGNSNAPRVDHPASSGITDYTLSYSSNYDGGMNAVSDNWIGLPANHGAASVADQESYYPPYYVLAYIMKT